MMRCNQIVIAAALSRSKESATSIEGLSIPVRIEMRTFELSVRHGDCRCCRLKSWRKKSKCAAIENIEYIVVCGPIKVSEKWLTINRLAWMWSQFH